MEIEDLKLEIKELQDRLKKYCWTRVNEKLPEVKKTVELCNVIFPDGNFAHAQLLWSTSLLRGVQLVSWQLKCGTLQVLPSYTHWRYTILPENEHEEFEHGTWSRNDCGRETGEVEINCEEVKK